MNPGKRIITALLVVLVTLSVLAIPWEGVRALDLFSTQSPTDEILPEQSSTDVILPDQPPYDMVTLFDGEFLNENGDLLGNAKWVRPVFHTGYAFADVFNAAFGNQFAPFTQDAAAALLQEDIARTINTQAGFMAEATFANESVWEETYRSDAVISFKEKTYTMSAGAAHPNGGFAGKTFNLKTGQILKLSDILQIEPEQFTDTVYQLYVEQQNKRGSGRDELALSPDYQQSVKDQCGEDAVFWLDEFGVNVYFHRYTFYFTMGDSTLKIPYHRDDLLQPEYVKEDPPWRKPFLEQLMVARDLNDQLSFSMFVEIDDICGDETPELLYITLESNTSYLLYVWGYDGQSMNCLIDGARLGYRAGADGNYGVAELANGGLLTLESNGNERGHWYAYQKFEFADGQLTLTKAIKAHGDSFIDTQNDALISEAEFEAERTKMLEAIVKPIVAYAYSRDLEEPFKPFINDNASNYYEIIEQILD